MSSRVDTAFQEWTAGLDPLKSRISIFEHIRNIPYALNVPPDPAPTGPERLLAHGRGSCGPKHHLLAVLFGRLGLEVVFVTFPFLWNDPDLRYPPALRQLAAAVPVSRHLACRVLIDTRWVLVDATWDLPLKRAGFPVNEDWDGRSDTICAVKPLPSPVRTAFCQTATSIPCRPGHTAPYTPLDGEDGAGGDGRVSTSVPAPVKRGDARRFFDAFDAWLEDVRAGPLPE